MVSAYSIQGKINEALNMAGEKFEDCRREGQREATEKWNRVCDQLAKLSNECMRLDIREQAEDLKAKAIEDLAYRAPEMLPITKGDLP